MHSAFPSSLADERGRVLVPALVAAVAVVSLVTAVMVGWDRPQESPAAGRPATPMDTTVVKAPPLRPSDTQAMGGPPAQSPSRGSPAR